MLFWAYTISVRFRELAQRTTGNTHRLIDISYEIIWAQDLKQPNNAYLELLDHPAKTTLYSFSDDTANQNKTPIEIFDITLDMLNGIITQVTKLKNKLRQGDNKKIKK